MVNIPSFVEYTLNIQLYKKLSSCLADIYRESDYNFYDNY